MAGLREYSPDRVIKIWARATESGPPETATRTESPRLNIRWIEMVSRTACKIFFSIWIFALLWFVWVLSEFDFIHFSPHRQYESGLKGCLKLPTPKTFLTISSLYDPLLPAEYAG